MATTRTDRTTRLTLNVTPTGLSGITQNRFFNYVNPTLTDDKALAYGTKLGNLSTDSVNYVMRTDAAKLVAE